MTSSGCAFNRATSTAALIVSDVAGGANNEIG